MLVAVFRRRLKKGKTFSDFLEAWEAERGFGVPARVINAVAPGDPTEVLTIGFVDLPADFTLPPEVAASEAGRHRKIDEVIATTELRAFYEVIAEHDFSGDPRLVDSDSAESLFSVLRTPPT